MNMNNLNHSLMLASWLVAFVGCKPRFFTETQTKNLSATHVLHADFTEATGKIKYSLVGTDAEKEEVKSVKVSQLKSSDKAVFYKGKINANFLMGYDQEKKFYPSYAMEVATTNLNCRTLDSAWMGSKTIELNCVRSSSQPQQPQTDGNKQDTPQSPSPGVRPTASPSATPPASTAQGNKTPTVPSAASECTGAKVRNYAICRFFEGGSYGCYQKHGCITRMTASKCSSVKAELKNQYSWMVSRWDCSAGVGP